MYTVKELIEALQKCPQEYEVCVTDQNGNSFEIDMVGIDNDAETVDIFTV